MAGLGRVRRYGQLLPQRQVLENQTSMSARENDQQPTRMDETGRPWFSTTGPAQVAETA